MKNNTHRKSESGNVLFLILIAVALFAALSYAVTQSTRSGSGSTERETVLLNSAGLTQYPTALRTAVVRMILSGSGADTILFDEPDNVNFGGASAASQVFHPTGGGAVYQTAPAEVMASGGQGVWRFNGNFEVPEIGQDGAGGNDIIAFLPGVSQSVCKRLNEELGVPAGGSPVADGIPDYDAPNASIDEIQKSDDISLPTTAVDTIESTSNAGDFDGQPSACFRDANYISGGGYIFYSILLER